MPARRAGGQAAKPAPPEYSDAGARFRTAAGDGQNLSRPRAIVFTIARIDNVLTSPGKVFPTELAGLSSRLMALPCRNWISL